MRYTGTTHDISYAATLEFFEARGRTAAPAAPQTATMYQDQELARRRDACERDTVLPLLALRGDEGVLDIGCGYGRWAEVLAGRVGDYVGVDFSAELLKLGRARQLPRCRFERLAAQDVGPDAFEAGASFDLFLCSGILIYLNDADVVKLARGIARLAAPRARVYLREPMAVAGGRLTLDRFPSAELQAEYSAIYRTPLQCHELFGGPLREAGFGCAVERSLYPPDLCNRQETEQQIQLWTRTA
jgi:SAM-dependent methyltransferase